MFKLRKLRDYQQKLVDNFKHKSHFAIFWKMRLGKTLVTLRLCKYWDSRKVLIVAPYGAFYGWVEELHSEHAQHPLILSKRREDRISTMKREYDNYQYFLISKESNLHFPEVAEYYFDVVICDESTFLISPEKNVSKKRSNMSKFYCNNFRDAKHRIILTGTPNSRNEGLDYFQQMKFLEHKIFAPYTNYFHFRENNFVEIEAIHKFVLSRRGKVFLKTRMAKYCTFLDRKDIYDRKEKVYQVRLIQPDKKFNRIKERIVKELILQNEEEKDIKKSIYSIVSYTWLRQLCSGFIDKELVFKSKINELKYLLNGELKNESIVIWSCFLPAIELIHRTFKKSNFINGSIPILEREKRIKDFQNGKIKYLICQPQCMKYRVDLSKASTTIYYDTPLSLEDRQQTEDRVIKVTKKDFKLIIDLVLKDTIDEKILHYRTGKISKAMLLNLFIKEIKK
jgi:superfamily II DNA or RNA helicase